MGGSGAGKSWLAEKLQQTLETKAGRLALDDFYRDRSHLSVAQRAKLNFDNPSAIDWPRFEAVLQNLAAARPARVPSYDFEGHCRLSRTRIVEPKPILLVEGLWLLRRRSIRNFFGLSIFVAAPCATRLTRRLARDLQTRGRTHASVLEQFRRTVQPMHLKYVEPQKRWADLILRTCNVAVIKELASLVDEAGFGEPSWRARNFDNSRLQKLNFVG